MPDCCDVENQKELFSSLELYNELCYLMHDKNILVLDVQSIGYSVHESNSGVIYINPNLSELQKLYVLCHEIGHLFYCKKSKLKRRKIVGTEQSANNFAVAFLKCYGYDISKYNKFLKDCIRV